MNNLNADTQFNQELIHQDQMDIKEIWRILRTSRKAIAVILTVVMFLTIYFTWTTHPVYQATTIVMIKESQTDPSSFVFDFGMNKSQQRLQNEIEVLRSYNLHERVIVGLIDDNTAEELSLFETRYIRQRYRLQDFFLEWLGQGAKPVILPKMMDFSQRIEIVEKLRENTSISTVRDADVLKIAVSSGDSAEAVFLANRISQVYRNLDLAGGQGELHFVLTFLDSQIIKYENRLAVVEDELQRFQSQNKIYALDGSAELLLLDLTTYEGIYYTNIAELQVAQERVSYLKSQLSESEKALMEEITNTNNPMIVALRGKIAELEAQKVQQMVDEGWSDQSLQSRDYERRIFEMKKELTGITESLILSGWSEEDPFAASQEIFNKIVEQEVEVHSARSRAAEYKKLVDQMSRRLTSLPAQTLQYARLERNLKLNENLYLTMKQKYEESRITEAGQLGKVRILDPALVAEKVKPNKKMNLVFGLFLGFGLGVGYAILSEFLDNTVKAVEHLERKGLTILGIIPDMQGGSAKATAKAATSPSKGGTDFQRRLITYEDPKSPISESYRSLRTNVAYASADKVIKSLLISSSQPGEGKSTTTANLAIAFAQLRKKTLLIDADLRKPVQHNVFGHSRGPGLSEFLIGEVKEINSIIHKTKVENLSLITAGGLPPNPSELLGSDKMSELVDQLEKEWDIVLLDSPPIVAVTDASMISGEIDAIALVVKAGTTERSAVDRALDILHNTNAPLIGAILNGASQENLGGKYAYYYSYYNYS
ncbi:MAG: polysaccharide biosynthesis tyrosine autokinase [Candidatus Marinimicrobia bacterium]|jgi:capsular exopolysaccharide synthesis family protein|nr:polysaccharide biosynthesis tyrosine autokinase [Candidatus Neomarinimicrobiota bacterium]MBT5268514.1 polysaccharide biosynthesis tyrosine autokinase [Candidatus Neomarinimicrobiota bacterium]